MRKLRCWSGKVHECDCVSLVEAFPQSHLCFVVHVGVAGYAIDFCRGKFGIGLLFDTFNFSNEGLVELTHFWDNITVLRDNHEQPYGNAEGIDSPGASVH